MQVEELQCQSLGCVSMIIRDVSIAIVYISIFSTISTILRVEGFRKATKTGPLVSL